MSDDTVSERKIGLGKGNWTRESKIHTARHKFIQIYTPQKIIASVVFKDIFII